MEEHPIPQNISSYQFRLVGDMTLKQFFEIAGGALVALLIYTSNFPGFLKIPLIVGSFLIGVALAFLPLEDRPLEVWVKSFIKSIYSPVYFKWHRTDNPIPFYQPEVETLSDAIEVPDRSEIEAITAPENSKLDAHEQAFLSQVDVHLETPFDTQTATYPAAKTPDNLGATPPKTALETEVIAPIQTPTPFVSQTKKTEQLEQFKHVTVSSDEVASSTYGVAPAKTVETPTGTAAVFSPGSAPPLPPNQPNVVVGQVIDSEGNIVPSAILEIIGERGLPVRALRSNKLGHFMIVTPLANGKYKMLTEKEGLVFDPVLIDARGEIIPPMAVTAKPGAVVPPVSDIGKIIN